MAVKKLLKIITVIWIKIKPNNQDTKINSLNYNNPRLWGNTMSCPLMKFHKELSSTKVNLNLFICNVSLCVCFCVFVCVIINHIQNNTIHSSAVFVTQYISLSFLHNICNSISWISLIKWWRWNEFDIIMLLPMWQWLSWKTCSYYYRGYDMNKVILTATTLLMILTND